MPTLRDRFPIQRRKILKKSFVRCAGGLVIAAVLSAVLLAMRDALIADESSVLAKAVQTYEGAFALIWLGLIILIVLYPPITQYIYFRSYFYDVDDRNVIIRKGVVSKRELTLPLSKITDVSVDQDVFDVFLGLYDLHLSTPTVESGKFAHIDGLNKQGAKSLRALILDRIHEKSQQEKE